MLGSDVLEFRYMSVVTIFKHFDLLTDWYRNFVCLNEFEVWSECVGVTLFHHAETLVNIISQCH